MNRKIIVAVLIGVFMSLGLAPAIYGQTSQGGPSGTATATAPSYLEFALSKVVRMSVAAGDTDPFTQGTDVSASPSFNFGTLFKQTDSTGKFLFMRGEYFYYVLMVAATSGRRYKITESGAQLTGPGGATLAQESVLLVPDYQWKDKMGSVEQGAPPSGAYVGSVTSATKGTGVESLVYQSDNAGLGRLVRTILGVGGPGSGTTYPQNYSLGYNGTSGQGTKQEYTSWKPVTQDQVSGAYNGSITFTLTLN